MSSLRNNSVMVILDNHLTKPGWCCGNNDGNGFFGDKYFSPNIWIEGLTKMAKMFKDVSNVIGMSLRNELRGPKQNEPDWFKYMQKGAEAVHSSNPNALVILSGFNYDTTLSFLKKQKVNVSFTGKLVFELHRYSFTDARSWTSGNANQVCANVTNKVMEAGLFLLQKGYEYPLFLSEFGVDQRGTNTTHNRYLNCLLGLAAEHDLDWAYWTLMQNYYVKSGVIEFKETYGILDGDHCEIKNTTMLQKITALQYPFQGPGLTEAKPHKVIFHPATGLCVQKKSMQLGACSNSEAWIYTKEKTLTIMDTNQCVQADELGKTPKLGVNCSDSSSKWELTSASKMHLSSQLKKGTPVCLDVDGKNEIVTNSCKCINEGYNCDPASQWFKLVDSTRS